MAVSPNTDNYTLGKGVVFFNRKDMATKLYTGERDLGNAPAFSFNIALEKLEHFSSRGGLKAKDKEIISQITPGCSFTLDEINKENLSLLTLAELTEIVQATGTVTGEAQTAFLGKRTKLENRMVSSVVVTDAATGLVTYVEGPEGVGNYQIVTDLKDEKIGRIYINADQTGATDQMTDGEAILVDYSMADYTYTEVRAFKETQVEGMLRFVSDNPAGTQQELEIWRCSLTPSGDTAMIGDDWSTLGFTGEILKDEVGHPDSPYMNIIME
jgi:hypothetical protein